MARRQRSGFTHGLAPAPAAVLFLALCLLAALISVRGELVLFDRPYHRNYHYSVTLQAGPAQRCYTLSCFMNKTTMLEWSGFQEYAWLVFFTEPGCQGRYAKAFGSYSNVWHWYNSNMDNRLASVMVWESSIYPTRGIVDACPQERYAFLNSSSDTLSAYGGDSGSGEGNSTIVGDV